MICPKCNEEFEICDSCLEEEAINHCHSCEDKLCYICEETCTKCLEIFCIACMSNKEDICVSCDG